MDLSQMKGQAPAPPPFSVSNAAERIDQSIEYVQVLIKRLQAVNDRLHGGEPRPVNAADGAAAVPSALLPMLRMRNEHLSRNLDILSREIERLESAL